MNTTQLECFMAVSNFLNFSRAAEQLRITQPAVSHQINTLEDELGVKLFHRTSKSVRLTSEGFVFTQYASEILRLSGLSYARMKECRESMPERIGLGCRNIAELRLLQPALQRLREHSPDVIPALRLIPFDSLENLLKEGEIHMMFSFRETAPAKVRYRELTRARIACLCGKNHPLAQRETVTVKELRGPETGRIAICRPPNCPQTLFTIQHRIMEGRSPDQMLFCDNVEVSNTLVGVGYAFAITMDFPSARIPGMRYVPMPDLEPLSFGAVYLPQQRTSVLRRFLDDLEESLRAQENA